MYDWNKKHSPEPELRPLTKREQVENFARSRIFGPVDDMLIKLGRERAFVISYAILAAILIAIATNGSRVQVQFEDNTLRLSSVQRGTGIVMVDQNNEILTMIASSRQFDRTYTVNYLGRTFRRSSDMFRTIYTFSTGHTATREYSSYLPLPIAQNAQQREEADLLRELIFMYNTHRPAYSLFGFTVLALVILALGVANLFFPEKFWRSRHELFVQDGKPTDFALFIHQATGIGIIVISFVLMATMR